MSAQVNETMTPVSQPVTSQGTGGLPIPIQRALRGVQVLFAVIVLGTVGAVVSDNRRLTGCVYDEDFNLFCYYTPGSFYYAIFASVWTIIISIYFIVSTFQTKIFFAIPALALDFLGILFWFSSFVSLAVWLGAADRWWSAGRTYGRGRSLLGAGTAFGAFLWLSYVAALVLNLRVFLQQRKARNPVAVPMQQQQHQQPPPPPPQQYQYQQQELKV